MRADLKLFEQVDLYLNDQLSGAERLIFEKELMMNPELQQIVQDQQLLIRSVNRQAIMAEINAVATGSGGAWYTSATTWIVSSVIVVAGIIGAFYLVPDQQPQEELVFAPANLEENTKDDEKSETTDLIPETILEEEAVVISAPVPKPKPSGKPLQQSGAEKISPQVFETRPLFEVNQVQEVELEVAEEEIVVNKRECNRTASFPGGNMAMQRYFKKNLKFPGTAKKKKLEGNVKVNFFVYADGRIEVTKVECISMSSVNKEPFSGLRVMFNHKVKKLFENESERLFRLMPIWEPATDSNGNPVLAPMEIYIDFNMDGSSSAYDLDFDHSDGEYKSLID